MGWLRRWVFVACAQSIMVLGVVNGTDLMSTPECDMVGSAIDLVSGQSRSVRNLFDGKTLRQCLLKEPRFKGLSTFLMMTICQNGRVMTYLLRKMMNLCSIFLDALSYNVKQLFVVWFLAWVEFLNKRSAYDKIVKEGPIFTEAKVFNT